MPVGTPTVLFFLTNEYIPILLILFMVYAECKMWNIKTKDIVNSYTVITTALSTSRLQTRRIKRLLEKSRKWMNLNYSK